jgi:hypothetical protein
MYCLFVLFYVLFVCKCVLYYCHRLATQLQLNISYLIVSYHIRTDGRYLVFFLSRCDGRNMLETILQSLFPHGAEFCLNNM